VHGCLGQLLALHDRIRVDLAARPVGATTLVHLGDLIDRGPASAGVVDLLASGDPIVGVPTVNLMGNHERTARQALAGERAARTDWLMHGGREALASWGIDADSQRELWGDRVPAAHRAFLARLGLTHRAGGYFFVHAGVRPGIPLDAQSPDDLLGIRHMFLESEADFGAVVVHGHTPKPDPVIRANRIGIDTGAAFGGRLTCVVLEAQQMAFITAS
jgi:serine/threonine protein phosphatase 1